MKNIVPVDRDKEHDQSREKWRRSKEWSSLIRVRGEEIFKFMLGTLVDAPASAQNPSRQ